MGTEKIPRSTRIRGDLTVTGSLAAAGGVPSTAIQSITGTTGAVSTAAALTAIRTGTQTALITSSGSGAGWEVSLAATRTVGSVVTVAANVNSTAPVTLLLESTAQTLFGSTANAVVFSTNSSGTSVTLQKVSTAQYAILGFNVLSTAAKPTIGASTGTV